MPVTAGCLRSGRRIAKEALSQVSSRLHQEICWSFSAGGAEEVTAASHTARWLSEFTHRTFDEWPEKSKEIAIVLAIQRRYSAMLARLPSESRQPFFWVVVVPSRFDSAGFLTSNDVLPKKRFPCT